MKTIRRDQDVILGGNDLEQIYCFKNFPVYMGSVGHPLSEDVLSDMQWVISKASGAIQLNPLLPLEVVYPEAHGSGCVGDLWMKHHGAFANFISKYNPDSVLEIGGAHGILSKYYHSEKPETRWTIVEPNPTPDNTVRAQFIKGFFDDQFELDHPVDAVVHSHVFEHVYDPQSFVQHISGFLPEGKHLIFSLPNMEEMLKRKYTNCINFEHTLFLTEPYIEYLLHQHGFRILEHEYFLDDHSIFYACVRDKSIQPTELPSGLYEKNKKIYHDYVAYHEELIRGLNSKIADLKDDQKLYLFGAHVQSQYLLSFGLNAERVCCILDNDKNKHNKRLYGTSLIIKSPYAIANDTAPVCILRAGTFSNEITDQLRKINKEIEIIG